MKPEFIPNHLINVDEALEATVLGSVLNQPRLAGDLLRYVRKRAVFYKPEHQHIYDATAALYTAGEPIDMKLVANWLKQQGQGERLGLIDLVELSTNAYLPSIDSHCLILFQLAIKRFLAQYGQRLARAAHDPTTDALALLARVNTDVDDILGNISSIGEKSTDDYLKQVFSDIEEKKAGRKKGVTFGIQELDERTGGFAPGNYVILAGGTGQGKTGLVVNLIRHQCLDEKNHVGLFSLEMTGAEVMARLLAAETDYSNSEINRAHGLQWTTLLHKSARLQGMNTLHIHDKPVQSLELQYKIREWVRRYGIKIVIIDYIQLVKDSRYKSAYDRLTNLSPDLKALAQELGIVIVAVSQLSRAFEKRDGIDKRPMASDLRESGQLEQDANAILMLFRPGKYDIQYEDNSVDEFTMELHGVKFRGAKPTERNNPWLVDYDGACNRIARFGSLQFGSELTPLSQLKLDEPNF